MPASVVALCSPNPLGRSPPTLAWIHPDEAKAGKAIAVPLNQDALSVLRSRLGIHEVFVFTYRGKPNKVCCTKRWKDALATAGIEDFRWHDLRHTWASWHVQSGTSLQELMELGVGRRMRWSCGMRIWPPIISVSQRAASMARFRHSHRFAWSRKDFIGGSIIDPQPPS